jgi:hypothetical protein
LFFIPSASARTTSQLINFRFPKFKGMCLRGMLVKVRQDLETLEDSREVSERFVKSFTHLRSGAQPEITINLAAQKIENLFFSPDWWEQLDPDTRRYFEQCALSGTVLQSKPNPTGCCHGTALRWENVSIRTNMDACVRSSREKVAQSTVSSVSRISRLSHAVR